MARCLVAWVVGWLNDDMKGGGMSLVHQPQPPPPSPTPHAHPPTHPPILTPTPLPTHPHIQEALRRECGAHIARHQVDTVMAWPFFLFGLAVMALQLTIYATAYRHGSFPAAFALGLVSWLLAGVFGHEGLHWGISRRHPWLNHILGFYATAAMANPIIWKHQHTYSHHSFTNEHERDPDCHHFERMLRMHFANPHNAAHRLLVHRYVRFGATRNETKKKRQSKAPGWGVD
jgi:hypothetical protein